MFVILSVMVVILALAGLVLAFVAYPFRGRELTSAPWLGQAMSRAADVLPLVDPEGEEELQPARARSSASPR